VQHTEDKPDMRARRHEFDLFVPERLQQVLYFYVFGILAAESHGKWQNAPKFVPNNNYYCNVGTITWYVYY